MSSSGSDPRLGITPTVSVVGEAAVRAEPDEAMVNVSLSALKDTPGPALEDVTRRSDALLALLDELGVPASDRFTTGVSVREELDYSSRGNRSQGHRAVSTVAVRLGEFDVIGRLITRATTELDARVDGPDWQIAPENPIRLTAARLAAADGQRKAAAYAEGVGAQLGDLLRLTEQRSRSFSRIVEESAAVSAGHMPVAAGDQKITATIEVTYSLIPAPR